MRTLLLSVAATVALAMATGAQAKKPDPAPAGPSAVTLADLNVLRACDASFDISPAAVACRGFYEGNLLNNSGDNTAYQQLALAELGFTWDGVNFLEEDTSTDGDPPMTSFLGQINFANSLAGTFYFGIHFGNGMGSPGRGLGGDTTAFYKVSGGAGLDFINLNWNSGSTARLYGVIPDDGPDPDETGVPEPATWAMMILGFGAAGSMLRRRRSVTAA